MVFSRDGAQRIRSAVSTAALHDIGNAVADLPAERAGIRLHGITALRPFLVPTGPVGAVATCALGQACQPVRAILFDKTPASNWSLAWHQDRTIAVTERIEVDGFGPWTVKSGLLHVAPPFDLLAGMVTLRFTLIRCRRPMHRSWSLRGRTGWGVFQRPKYRTWCDSAVRSRASPMRATFGSMRRRFCMRRRRLSNRFAAGSSKSTSRPEDFLVD